MYQICESFISDLSILFLETFFLTKAFDFSNVDFDLCLPVRDKLGNLFHIVKFSASRWEIWQKYGPGKNILHKNYIPGESLLPNKKKTKNSADQHV